MGNGTAYSGSDGYYYGDVDLWQQFECGVWIPFCWDTETGIEWVEAQDGEILTLTPISQSSLPREVSVEEVYGGLSIDSSRKLSTTKNTSD
ncbi:hypothetical protein SAMN04487948_11164 [Halogranum amylolyticum]|uniref:Uncharacterized protein n=1 Tax=Halogranum amylolyticum TaxID=660520 RepID=A0A1H8UJ20_9EURY|nr:hypothetical protein [Halogranum amylolyticum]SEP03017.1 hypothetical protein SAMN04487948_11164 [Halogranum amylolyticum]